MFCALIVVVIVAIIVVAVVVVRLKPLLRHSCTTENGTNTKKYVRNSKTI